MENWSFFYPFGRLWNGLSRPPQLPSNATLAALQHKFLQRTTIFNLETNWRRTGVVESERQS
jgi:hypothetical protein